MRTSILTFLFLLGIIGIGSIFPTQSTDVQTKRDASKKVALTLPQQSIAEYEWYPVVKVIDGDTIVVNIEGKNTTIRLIGLDTPETVDPRKTVQCFGAEASAQMKQIISGQSVRLEYDPSQGTIDKYGRLLAYVYAPANVRPEGILLNRYMIAEGYGHEYTYHIPYAHQSDFKAAETEAQAQKKGLWAKDACALEVFDGTATPVSHGEYECGRNAYNCSDFKTQSEAQKVFDACGPGDIHKLDSDGDKRVCESLP